MAITCTIHLPSLQGWLYTLAAHGGLLVGAGIPAGTLLYKLPPSLQKIGGLSVAVVSAVAVHQGMPLFEHALYPAEDTKPVYHWMGLFVASSFGFATFFKSVAVAYQQCPEGATSNLFTFLLWFLCLPEPIFAKGKLKQATRHEIMERIACLLGKIIGLFVLVTLLLDGNQILRTTVLQWLFPMLPQNREIPTWLSSMTSGYLHIWFIYLFASFCLDFSTVTIGYPTSRSIINGASSSSSFYSGFRNPLWSSRSIKEIWGTRWNTPVQTLLQRSVYIPARKAGWSRGAAVGSTFFVSGLLHEYTFSIHNASAYHRPGETTVFFLLMSLAMMVEDFVVNVKHIPVVVRPFVSGIPSPIISTLLAMIAACFMAPLFFHTWIEAGAIESMAALMPHLVCQ